MTTEINESTPSPAPRSRRRLRRWLGTLLVAAVLLVFPIRVAVQLAADPEGAKDCPPVSPDDEHVRPVAPRGGHPAEVPWLQKGGAINDASCLSRTAVHGIVRVTQAEDVRRALAFAKANGLKTAIAGVRHSMGGHAFARGAVVLDMTAFNRMSLDAASKTLRVESGASWHDIQRHLHPRFAVKAMQSTDIFTVGGSISVNAHGMDHRAGSVGRSIRAMRVMRPDGVVEQLSPTENPRLFNLVVGGYGLFGVILDVDLEVTDNVVYQSERRIVDYRAFPTMLNAEILPNASVGLMYGHLSTSPASLLEEMLVYTYRKVEAPPESIPALGEVGQVKLRRLVFNLAKHGGVAMRLKWWAEKRLEPMLESCPVPRTQAMGEGEACLVSRNHPMHDSVEYLRNNLPRETDILHEYFIPERTFVAFVDGLRRVVREERASLLNASVRVVHRETNALSYAPEDGMLAVVLYLNQSTDRAGSEHMARLTRRLIDLSSDSGGRFFLPYQTVYTAEQLRRSYPEIDAFFAAKRELDPDGLLSNAFYEKYAPHVATVGRR
jgi:FAD/FMN-containing dehydrogenase